LNISNSGFGISYPGSFRCRKLYIIHEEISVSVLVYFSCYYAAYFMTKHGRNTNSATCILLATLNSYVKLSVTDCKWRWDCVTTSFTYTHTHTQTCTRSYEIMYFLQYSWWLL